MNIPKYLDLYRNELEFKNYSDNTIRTYTGLIKLFLEKFSDYTEPKKIQIPVIKEYIKNSGSISSLKQNIGAIKRFYQYVIKQPLKFKYIEYPRKVSTLPRVIDQDDIVKRLSEIVNLKHRAVLTLTYCCGLRVSEIVNLKIEHIDGKNRIILISQAKGNKDRYVPVSEFVLNLLREYFATFSPKIYLFNGQNSIQYSVKSCQQIFKKYVSTQYSFHHLRHSALTAMLENGTDIRTIQVIAGHKSVKTTQIYTHISKKFLATVNTPI